MSVAGASLVVAVTLVAVAVIAWILVRAEPAGESWAHQHRTALADWALVALALHAFALIVEGTPSPGAYGLTVLLACAAGWVRQPIETRGSAPAARRGEAAATPHMARGAEAAVPVAPSPRPAEPAAPRRTLWAESR